MLLLLLPSNPTSKMLKVSLNSSTFPDSEIPSYSALLTPLTATTKKIVEVQLYGNLHKGMYSIFALGGGGGWGGWKFSQAEFVVP